MSQMRAGEPGPEKRSFSPLDAGVEGRKRSAAGNEIDIQDSLAPRTEREDKSLTERTIKDDKVTTTNTAYQDSLDSYTPTSQRVPLKPTLQPSESKASDIKDKYDPKNVSHRQYFMP